MLKYPLLSIIWSPDNILVSQPKHMSWVLSAPATIWKGQGCYWPARALLGAKHRDGDGCGRGVGGLGGLPQDNFEKIDLKEGLWWVFWAEIMCIFFLCKSDWMPFIMKMRLFQPLYGSHQAGCSTNKQVFRYPLRQSLIFLSFIMFLFIFFCVCVFKK